MRRATIAWVLIAAFLAASLGQSVAGTTAPRVIQFGYHWGSWKITGAEVVTFGGTNLTMDTQVSERNGTRVEEITEFTVDVVAPGRDAYPPTNGTNPYPYPQIAAAYDTLQVITDPNRCVPSNNSVGFTCGAPSGAWQHQVLRIRFLRLVEFTDANGDGGYQVGEPVVSELDLADRSLQYGPVSVAGLNATTGPQTLSTQIHYPDVCCGESWAGWIGQNDTPFPTFDGLTFRIAATGPANVTITGYQWFTPREFQGVNLTPLQSKLDLTIGSYPFVDSNSRLALELNFTSFSQGSDTNWEVVPWPEGQGIGADSVNTTAIFAWSSKATADGAPTTVVGTVVPVDPLSRHIYLGYPRADLIEHDPLFGITDKRANPAVVIPPAVLLSAAAIAFIATLAVASAVIYTAERRKR